jgi:hypothetical protein
VHLGLFLFLTPIGLMVGRIVQNGLLPEFVAALLQFVPVALFVFCLMAGMALLLRGKGSS